MARRDSKVLLYDESGWVPRGTSRLTQFALSTAWALGTRLFRGRSIGASSWREALADLDHHQSEKGRDTPIRELHVWGHGYRGQPRIGPHGRLDVGELAEVCPELEVVFWRSCSVHASQRFAAKVCDATKAISIGHCETISAPNPLRQVAISALRPGEAPFWDVDEDGVWRRTADDVPLPSISTLRNRVPYHLDGMWSVDMDMAA